MRLHGCICFWEVAGKAPIYHSIYFWIGLLFFVRLIGITNPPLEKGHNWRQVTNLSVARNFAEVDDNILYPRVDDQGNSGIIGMEFPLLSYMHYVVAKVFGFEAWYGRLINLFVSTLGLIAFYKCLLIYQVRDRLASYATVILGVSIWFSFSRKMMSDTFCISLFFIGLYFGLKFLLEKKTRNLILYCLFVSLAPLAKIPAAVYFMLFIPLVFDRGYDLKDRIKVAAATVPAVLFTWVWYFRWNPHLSETYGNWYNDGRALTQGFQEIINHIPEVLRNFYFFGFYGYILFALSLAGLALMIYHKQYKLLLPCFLVYFAFVPYMIKSGFVFYHHNYYIIPFVPVMALTAGYALSEIRSYTLALFLLIAGVTESIANQQHDLFIKSSEQYKLDLPALMEEKTDQNDLLITVGNGNPQLMYFAHRKGWNLYDHQLHDTTLLDSLHSAGAQFLLIDTKVTSSIPESLNRYTSSRLNEHLILYDLD